jgi:hypothetical protein
MASDAEVVVVDVRAVARGYRLSKLIGYDVVNERDEEIGTLDDLIVAKDALFAVLQIGGFLRLGGRLIAIPFEQLDLSETNGTLRIVLPSATRETLQKLPEFDYRS